jgi:hypothetical protein
VLLLDAFGRRAFESATTAGGATTYVEPMDVGCSALTDVGLGHHSCEQRRPFG